MTIGPQALIDTVAGILRFDLGAKMLVAVLAVVREAEVVPDGGGDRDSSAGLGGC